MNKVIALGIVPLAVVGVIGTTSLGVSAMNGNGTGTGTGIQAHNGTGNGNGRQASLESRAKVVGMTTDELSKALETKTMSQIAKDKGMTENQFETKMTDATKARWQARGLSADEIAKRVAEREARHAANTTDHEWGSGAGNHQGGYGRNR